MRAGSIYRAICQNAEEYACVALLAVMTGLQAVQIALRYLFNAPLVWTEEAVRYLLVWLSMLGSVVVVKHSTHIRVDFFERRAGPRALPLLQRFQMAACAFLLLLLAYFGFQLAMRTSFVRTVTLPLNWSAVYASVPISMSLMLLRLIQRALHGTQERG